MKKVFLIPILFLITFSARSQEKFIVQGKLTEVGQNAKVFLTYHKDDAQKTDSVVSTNGEFSFSGTVDQPARATLEVKAARPANGSLSGKKTFSYDQQVFFLEKGVINVTGNNAKTAVIKGGKTQEEFTNLNTQLKPLQDQSAALSEKLMTLWRNSDTTGRSALFAQSAAVSAGISKREEDFIRSNPNSFVSLSLLEARANYIDPAKFGPMYNGLSALLRNTEEGKALESRLEIVRKTSVGNPAINFTQNTTDQKPFTLSSLRGKYVLIDFWASWCGPCRGESPYLVEAYHTFKDKKFEIVSVSLDEKKEPWLAAIKKDGLSWIHVSDLKGWHNEVAVTYGIRAIPRNFLIDPNGIIIAKNLRGDELMKKLKQILEK